MTERRTRKREAVLAAAEEKLTKLARGVSRRTKAKLSAAAIGVKAGRVVGRHEMGKRLRLTMRDGYFTWEREDKLTRREKFRDGTHVVRTREPAEELSAPDGVRDYKRLAQLEGGSAA